MNRTDQMECPVCGGTRWNFIDSQGSKWGNAECVWCGIVSPEVRTGYDLSDGAQWHADAVEALQGVVYAFILYPLRTKWKRYVAYMERGYGKDFTWTCDHLAELDKMLGDGRHVDGAKGVEHVDY